MVAELHNSVEIPIQIDEKQAPESMLQFRQKIVQSKAFAFRITERIK